MHMFFLSILLGAATPAESVDPDGFVIKAEPERVLVEVTVPHKGRYCGIHMIVDGHHELVLFKLKPDETLTYEEKLYMECSNNMKRIHLQTKYTHWDYTPMPSGRSKWTPRTAPSMSK